MRYLDVISQKSKLRSLEESSLDKEYSLDFHLGRIKAGDFSFLSKISNNQYNDSYFCECVLDNIKKFDTFDNKQRSYLLGDLDDKIDYFSNTESIKESVKIISDKIGNNLLSDKLDKVIACNRIINNDRLLNEKVKIDENFWDLQNYNPTATILSLVSDLNNIEESFSTRFSTLLENASYSFDKLEFPICSKDDLLQGIVEAACFYEDFDLNTAKSIIEDAKIETNKDILKYIVEASEKPNSYKYFLNQVRKEPSKVKQIFTRMFGHDDDIIANDKFNIVMFLRSLMTYYVISFLPIGTVGLIITTVIERIILVKNTTKNLKKAIPEWEKAIKLCEDTFKKEKDPEKKKLYKEYLIDLNIGYRKLKKVYEQSAGIKESADMVFPRQ